jgi:hypothetical protein
MKFRSKQKFMENKSIRSAGCFDLTDYRTIFNKNAHISCVR